VKHRGAGEKPPAAPFVFRIPKNLYSRRKGKKAMRKNPGSGTIPAGVMLEIYRNYRRSGGKKRLKDFPEVRRKLKRALKKKDLLRQAEGKTIAQLVMANVCVFDFLEIVAPRAMLPLLKKQIRGNMEACLQATMHFMNELQIRPEELEFDPFDHSDVLNYTKEYLDRRQQRNLRRFIARQREDCRRRLEGVRQKT